MTRYLRPKSLSPTNTTTGFSYEGDRVVRRVSVTGATAVTPRFTTEEAGAIINEWTAAQLSKMCFIVAVNR